MKNHRQTIKLNCFDRSQKGRQAESRNVTRNIWIMKATKFKLKVRTNSGQRTRVTRFDIGDEDFDSNSDSRSGYQTDQIQINKRQALKVERHMSLSEHVTRAVLCSTSFLTPLTYTMSTLKSKFFHYILVRILDQQHPLFSMQPKISNW